MAAEHGGGTGLPNVSQPPPPAAVTIPQYPEMILRAIETLNEKNGSNKSAISKHIESTYGNLPSAHSALLSHHLNRMKSTGELVFLKNNYLKPDPNAPPRRGRGRPPKPKSPIPTGVDPPSRPRGRPPKNRDLTESHPPPPKPKPVSASNVSGRKRGRPPKAAGTVGVPVVAPSGGDPSGPPRKRGRPPKVKQAVTAAVGA